MNENLLGVLLTAVLGRILTVFSTSLGSLKKVLHFGVSLSITVMLLSPLFGIFRCDFTALLPDAQEGQANDTGSLTRELQLAQTERVLCEEIRMMTAARFSVDKNDTLVTVAFDATDAEAVRVTEVSALIYGKQNRILCEKIESYLHAELLCTCSCRYGGEMPVTGR